MRLNWFLNSGCRLMVIITAFAAALTVNADMTEYFWTGSAGDLQASTAQNWKLANGTICTVPPVNAVDGGAILVFDGAGTLSVSNADGFMYAGYRFDNSSDVTFANKVTMGPEGVSLKGNANLTISNGIEFYDGTNVFDVATGSAVTYSGVVPSAAASSTTFVKRGGGDIKYASVRINSLGTLVMEGGTFGRSAGNQGFNMGATKILFNGGSQIVFYGVDLTFHGDWEDVPGCADHAFNKTSSGAKTITFKGNVRYTGHFMGVENNYCKNISLTYDPGVSTKAFVLDGGDYDCVNGKLTVKSGKMLIQNGGRISAASGVEIGSGAELEIDSTAGSFAVLNYNLTDSRSVLRLSDPGLILKASGVRIGSDTMIPAGIYEASASDFDWLKGEGTLVVGTPDPVEPEEITTACWTGAGADTLLTNPDNWEGRLLPDIESGKLVATFSAGETVTVPSDTFCWLKGVVFASPNALTVTGAQLKLGSSGIVTENAGKTYTVDCPLRLVTSQTWAIGKTDELVLSANGTVKATADDIGVITLSKTGGLLKIFSTNPHLLRFSLLGEVELWADDALGGRGAEASLATAEAMNYFHTYDCKLGCELRGTTARSGFFLHAHTGTTRLEGPVNVGQVNGAFYLCETGAKLVFAGGVSYVSGNNSAEFSPLYLKNAVYRVHDIVVENKPMTVTRAYFEHGTVCFNAAGNDAPRGFHLGDSETMVMGTSYALKATATGTSGIALRGRTSVLDLGGYDQAVNIFYGLSADSVVTSATEAVLHLVDNEFNTTKPNDGAVNLTGSNVMANLSEFKGCAGYSKEGALTNYLMATSSTAGRLCVSKGRLVMCRAAIGETDVAEGTSVLRAEGSWRNAASVTLSGTGTFVAEHDQAIGSKTEVRFEGPDARFEIPAGVEVRCAALYIDGVLQPEGRWDSGRSPLFVGAGTLTVGRRGLILIFE